MSLLLDPQLLAVSYLIGLAVIFLYVNVSVLYVCSWMSLFLQNSIIKYSIINVKIERKKRREIN